MDIEKKLKFSEKRQSPTHKDSLDKALPSKEFKEITRNAYLV
jgi:hypothetical protein